MLKKTIIISVVVIVLLFVFGTMWMNAKPSSQFARAFDGQKIIVYKSLSCGCCGNYVAYLKRAGFDVDVQNTRNLDDIKARYGVPSEVQTCHTAVLGDYFIEGHVALEAIAKLLNEKPKISGIGLAGMPSGTPGMPGGKMDTWNIRAVSEDGTTSEFMSL